MSGRGRNIRIEILGDAKDAQAAFDALEKSSGGFGDSLKNIGSIASGFIVAQGLMRLPDLFSSAVDVGSNLSESINAVNQIFGDSAQTILAWGEQNANSFGLSQRAFNDLAVPLGAGLKNAGLSMDEVSQHTISLTERAADMASVFNTDVDEALGAIQAGLRGEADPLERFGVGLSAAAVQAEAMAMTGKTVASELTNQELALARVNLIMKQTDDVAGDFKNTSDGVANSARIAAARQEELVAVIGQQLLPVQQALTQAKLAFLDVLANRVIPAVIEFVDLLKEPLHDAFVLVRDGVETFAEALSGDWTDAEGIQGVHRIIGNLGTLIHDDVLPVIADMVDLWGDVDAAVRDLPGTLQGIGDALSNLSFGDVTAGLSGIGGQIVGAIGASLDLVDWQPVRDRISGGLAVGFEFTTEQAQALVDGIRDAFEQTDWAAVQEQIRAGIVGGLAEGGEQAGQAGEQIQAWLTSEVQAVEDWAELGRAIKNGIVTGVSVASGGLALGLAVADWVLGEVRENEGDWKAVASEIAGKIVSGFEEAVETAEEIGGRIVAWIRAGLEEVEWESVGAAIATGVRTAVEEAADIQQAADEVADRLVAGLTERLSSGDSVGSFRDGVEELLRGAFGDIDLEEIIRDTGLILTPEAIFGEGGLQDALEDVFDEFRQIEQVLREDLGPTIRDAREAWEEWEPILRPILGLLLDITLSGFIVFVQNMIAPIRFAAEALNFFFEYTQIALGGLKALGELINLHIETAGEIIGWSQETGAALAGWADNAIEQGQRFLDGMMGPIDELALSGVQQVGAFVSGSIAEVSRFAGEVIEIMSGVPGQVVSAVGDLSRTLYNAGAQLIQGLIDGVRAMIPDLQGIFSEITAAIPDWKGPLDKDRELLHPSGVALMAGLFDGINERWERGRPELTQIGDDITSWAWDVITGIDRGFDAGLPLITQDLTSISAESLAILEEMARTHPEVVAGFVDDIIEAVNEGRIPWSKAIGILAELPRDMLIPILDDLEKQLREDIVNAVFEGEDAVKEAQEAWDEFVRVCGDLGISLDAVVLGMDDATRSFNDNREAAGRAFDEWDRGADIAERFPGILDNLVIGLDRAENQFDDTAQAAANFNVHAGIATGIVGKPVGGAGEEAPAEEAAAGSATATGGAQGANLSPARVGLPATTASYWYSFEGVVRAIGEGKPPIAYISFLGTAFERGVGVVHKGNSMGTVLVTRELEFWYAQVGAVGVVTEEGQVIGVGAGASPSSFGRPLGSGGGGTTVNVNLSRERLASGIFSALTPEVNLEVGV